MEWEVSLGRWGVCSVCDINQMETLWLHTPRCVSAHLVSKDALEVAESRAARFSRDSSVCLYK